MSRGVAENVFIDIQLSDPSPHRCGLQPGSRQPEGIFLQTRKLLNDLARVNRRGTRLWALGSLLTRSQSPDPKAQRPSLTPVPAPPEPDAGHPATGPDG